MDKGVKAGGETNDEEERQGGADWGGEGMGEAEVNIINMLGSGPPYRHTSDECLPPLIPHPRRLPLLPQTTGLGTRVQRRWRTGCGTTPVSRSSTSQVGSVGRRDGTDGRMKAAGGKGGATPPTPPPECPLLGQFSAILFRCVH